MRRKVLAFLLMTILLLSACGPVSADDLLKKHAEKFESLDFKTQAALTVHQGDVTMDFTIVFAWKHDGECALQVKAPEELEGIKARYSTDKLTFTFEDTVLDMSSEGFSPLNAMYGVFNAWAKGVPLNSSQEKLDGTATLALAYEDVHNSSRTWFNAETLIPLRTEIYTGGVLAAEAVYEVYEQ